MSDLIQIIKDNREPILIGEIGALLHDIGKYYPHFIGTNSIENTPNKFHHTNIDDFLDVNLVNLIKNNKLKLNLNGKEIDVYTLISKHHDRDPKEEILKIMIECDRLDSADDKGIVRKKQSISNTIISSPFGRPKEKIDLECLQNKFNVLQNNLSVLLNNYISENISLTCLRESLLKNLQSTFSHALGETRIPSNDVTLWDHSHSTASLFKSALCSLALGENSKDQELKWRLLGFCWDGIGFINKGKKVADILKRNEIIEEIKKEIKNKFEDEIPIGNAIYEDINGIYFTFPALTDDKAKELARECAKDGLVTIENKSNNEIWPFFTLSKPSRTLTILTKALEFASEKRNIPKISPMIFFENDKDHWNSVEIDNSLNLYNELENEIKKIKSKNKDAKIDICPICRIRPKGEDGERCEVCENRRKGRLSEWLNNRENTIWIDEVADANNRIALLTLSFDLDKWLDGTMIGTIYSQSFEDWYNSRATEIRKNTQFMNKIKKSINREINNSSVNELAELFMEYFIKKVQNDPDFLGSQDEISLRTKVFNTFFEDFTTSEKEKDEQGNDNPLYVKKVWGNFKEKLDVLDTKNALHILFTQNPSPARLYRIWRETEEFFELVVNEIKSELYSHKWKRCSLKVNAQSLKLKNGNELKQNTPYIIKIKELEPKSILIIHTSNEQFYTIESLEKFKFKEKTGIDAVKDALKTNEFYWFVEEEDPNKNLLQNGQIKIDKTDSEEYFPLIEITKSPVSLKLIVPAKDTIKILKIISKIYNEIFEKVIGKLPLNVGLLVSKKKFPIYTLLDASERILNSDVFKEQVEMNAWWNPGVIDECYGFYPTRKLTNDEKYTLDDLVPISKGKPYFLYPGYFDFDLLLSTTDRYNITYKNKKRAGDAYSLYSARPYYFHQISQMIELWEILKNNLSLTQINYVEEILNDKLREWRNVEDQNKKIVYNKFVEATIKDAFGDKWQKIGKETQDLVMNSALNGLLLDTIVLFRHIIKEDDENE